MPFPSKTGRELILKSALEQVARDGIDKIAIRSVAAALELAPNALYRYFSGLADLKGALAQESLRLLHQALIKAAGKKSPSEAIRGIARGYLRFSREHPQIFALTLRQPAEFSAEATHLQMWDFFLGHVGKLYGGQQAPEAAVTLWAFLHGMTALEAAGVLGDRKPASSFEFGLSMWIAAGNTHSNDGKDQG